MTWTPPHIISAIFWLIWAVGFFVLYPFGIGAVVRVLGGVLLIIHLVECAVFWKRIDAAGNPVQDVIRVLFFGIFHARTLPKVEG